MAGATPRLEKAERDLERARQILTHPVHNYQPEEWMLLATLVGEADLTVREEREANPALDIPLLDEVIADLREVTRDFTDSAFLSSTGAARRHNPQLFSGRSR